MNEQRDAAAVRVFPPAVPILVILIGYFLGRVCAIDLGFALAAPERYWLGGAIVVCSVLGLGMWAVLLFRLTGEKEFPWEPTYHIEQRGPFRITRNPMYLQMVLVCIGTAIFLMNWWILILTPVGAWVLHRFAILPEEAYLERKFGETYLAYKRRVRRWI